ncbi:hypothetical protein BKA63DRAFT_100176 [Paraphoma chrysanthemicola]|nr:hypothetical protein BKA63DRAFT_100176 [Paraphoma chrysanthemicola]
MTRVHHTRPQRGTALDRQRADVKKKKPYKIVLEAVTQEKKKLHSILSYASNAPKGFGFIPAGHPEFTEWCKEQCRQRNLDVHIVSAKPKNRMHADPEKLSHHVHRVGHHFPLEIVNLACSKFGYIYDESHGLRKDKSRDRTNWIAQRVEDYSSRQALHGRPATEKESKEYTSGAVREMFPKIPEADLTSIVNHAFEEGTNRVGNAKELSLARRVQLAVVAHIRHMYTDYDKILKTGSWMQARQQVEHVSLAKLKEWRDETGEQSNEIEETFREVIVLDDDEESSDEGSLSTPDEREQSMEIVSSRATARDLQPDKHIDYTRMDAHSSGRIPRRTIVVQPYNAYHHEQPATPTFRQPVSYPAATQAHTYASPAGLRTQARGDSFGTAHSRPVDPRTRPAAARPTTSGPQGLVQEIDGQLYHLEPIREDRDPPRLHHGPPLRAVSRYAQKDFVQRSPQVSTTDRPSAHSRRPSEQDIVLPSVERDTVDLTSPRRPLTRQSSPHDPHLRSNVQAGMASPKRKAYPPHPESRGQYVSQEAKRPRPVYYESETAPPASQMPRIVNASYLQPREAYRPMAHPPQPVIDLTSSPHRPVYRENRSHLPAYPRAVAESSGLSYVPVLPRRSPPRDARGPPPYEVYHGEPPRPYMPNSGMYERHAPPVRDHLSVRDEPRRVVEGDRDFRRVLHYGGPDLH